MSAPLFECQDCCACWEEGQLVADIKHLSERVAPGEPMPAGECADCGALCHEVKVTPVEGRPFDNMVAALTRIRDARDYCAEHGNYPEGWLGEDQSFDDWAADIAETVLAQVQS